jgi:flagellar biosynthetic protein FlhB
MSDKPDKESQTEDATEKRLHDSVEKGETPSSREVTLFASLSAALLFFVFFLRSGAARLVVALQNLLGQSGQLDLGGGRNVMTLFSSIGEIVGAFILPAFILFIVAALVASAGQNPLSISPDRIAPKLNRISPGAGWSRLVSVRGLAEFGKNIAKLLAMGGLVFMTLRVEMNGAVATLYSDPSGLPDHLLAVAIKLLSAICVGALVLAGGDFIWSRMHWKRDLRMSRQEVKDEMKQMLGDPMVKARQRSIALERTRKRMMSAVPDATMVIANPTHYAIALRYLREEGGAPKVVAKGQDLIALKIREIAEEHGIPVIEDKALARSMYDLVEVDMMIPAEFYRVIAELIHFLNRTGQTPRPN